MKPTTAYVSVFLACAAVSLIGLWITKDIDCLIAILIPLFTDMGNQEKD